MTPDEFAEALAALIEKARAAGLSDDEITLELEVATYDTDG